MPVIDPLYVASSNMRKKISKLVKGISFRKIGTIYDELGALNPEKITLKSIKPDRRELDKIIMGDILGLTENEQLEVYRAVIDLVKSRLDKAKSLGKNNITIDGIDVTSLKKTIVERLNGEKD